MHIVEAVQNCDEEDSFWCTLPTEMDAFFPKLLFIVRIFYAIRHDRLIQKIVNNADIGESIQRHQGKILDQYEQAQNLIEARGAMDRLKLKDEITMSIGFGIF